MQLPATLDRETLPLGPCLFRRFGDDVLLTSPAGDWYWTGGDTFVALLNGALEDDNPLLEALRTRGMLAEGVDQEAVAARFAERLSFLDQGPEQLTLFVGGEGGASMDTDTAERAIRLAYGSTSTRMACVVRGTGAGSQRGRAALDFAEQEGLRSGIEASLVAVVDASELVAFDDTEIAALATHASRLMVSASIADLSSESLAATMKKYGAAGGAAGVEIAVHPNEALRVDTVSDACVGLGFTTVTVRYAGSPFDWTPPRIDVLGQAVFALAEKLRASGIQETTACDLLRAVLSGSTAPIGLRSPAADGIGRLSVDTDGTIYVSDSGLQLGREGDDMFAVGNVGSTAYVDVIEHATTRAVLVATSLFAQPGAADHAYLPFVGVDAGENYALHGTIQGILPRSPRFRFLTAVLDGYFGLLRGADADAQTALKRWAD